MMNRTGLKRREFLRKSSLGMAAMALPSQVSGASAESQAFSFAQISDTQLGFGGYELDLQKFRQAVKQINALQPDFVVICGDLVDKANDQSFADFLSIKEGFEIPCYCAAGNHDIGNEPTEESLKRYRTVIGEDYYSFEHKGKTIATVNTQLWKSPLVGEAEEHDRWFENMLRDAAEKNSPVFVFGHYPLFLKTPDEEEGYFNLPIEKRRKLLNQFEKHGVVAMLGGHAHKLIINDHQGIQLVNAETTSKNFDSRPFGFRLWHVDQTRPYACDFVGLEGFNKG